MKIEDVVIIGAGPAGISAAIQLKRSGLEPLLLEKSHVGGLLVNADLVENYPGFPQGVSGAELVGLFEAHLDRMGVVVNFEEVLELDHLDHDEHFVLKTSKRTLQSRVVVVATGTKPKRFDAIEIPGEAADRVFYEVYPIAGVEGRRIAVIGAGDAAFDYALNLARRNEVTILNQGNRHTCLPLLWERARNVRRIEYLQNVTLSAVKPSADGLVLSCTGAQGDRELAVDYVIFATGRMAQEDFFSVRLKETASELEEEGLLYLVGDVRSGMFRQTSIAVGDGVKAAMRIYHTLRGVG